MRGRDLPAIKTRSKNLSHTFLRLWVFADIAATTQTLRQRWCQLWHVQEGIAFMHMSQTDESVGMCMKA